MSKAPRKAPQVPGETGKDTDTRGAGLDLDAVGTTAPTKGTAADYEDDVTGADVTVNTESDVDAAIALAQSGQARPIIKPRAPVAPAVLTRPDPSRPPGAAVNQAPTMDYDEAIERQRAAEELLRLRQIAEPTEAQAIRMAELDAVALKRSVLTDQGWVTLPSKPPAENKR